MTASCLRPNGKPGEQDSAVRSQENNAAATDNVDSGDPCVIDRQHHDMSTFGSFPFLSVLLFMTCGVAADELPGTKDLVTPAMTDEQPAAGRRVRQVAPEYEGTEVYHALYLPVDWKPGRQYPVVVEYTGNRFPASGSTGEVRDANLGFGLTGGHGSLWVTMPCIAADGRRNALTWWGDRRATIDYCKTNLPRICAEYGGDPDRVFLCGFSRGAIAVSYIGLADDEIASFWKGFVTHDHFDGDRTWSYPHSDRRSALNRLARLKGRPVLACGIGTDFLREHADLADFTFLQPPVAKIFTIPDGPVIHPHTDLWMHRASDDRAAARQWLQRHQ